MQERMNWSGFDWNQARAFLVTALEGSLSAAARQLEQTQPTLSRQVVALEQQLGVTLFERVGKRLDTSRRIRVTFDLLADALSGELPLRARKARNRRRRAQSARSAR